MSYFSKSAMSANLSGVRKVFELENTMVNPINLSLGMPDIEIPEQVKKEAVDYINFQRPGYSITAGILEVRKAAAKKMNEKNNIPAKAEEIIISSGATGALTLTMLAILDKEDEIIIIDPFFVLYSQMIDFIGAKKVCVSSYPDFRLPLAGIEKAITPKTKAILINTPNNPTGVVYGESELKALAEIARKNDLLIVSDEIYEDYIYDQNKHISIGSFYPKTVTIMGPSKTAALAGWRIAYLHAPAEYVEQMLKVQQIFFVCASTPGQYGLLASFSVDYSELRKDFQRKKDMVKNVLKEKYDVKGLEGSFYAFWEVENDEQYIKKMIGNNLLLVPGSVFSNKKTHVRMAYCAKDNVLEQALKIISME